MAKRIKVNVVATVSIYDDENPDDYYFKTVHEHNEDVERDAVSEIVTDDHVKSLAVEFALKSMYDEVREQTDVMMLDHITKQLRGKPNA